MELGLNSGTVIVTASSADLGHASAATLADEGADVVVCGRDPERLAATESEFGDLDGDVLGIETDITNKGDVEMPVEAVVEEFDGVDHVATSAGGAPPGSFADLTEREWYDAFGILVMSAVWIMRMARPHLEANGVRTITHITSTSVKEAIDDLILSNVVRRDVVDLMKSLSHKLAPDVRVDAVLPDAREASRIKELVEAAVERGDHDAYEEGLDSWSDGIPLSRVGGPRELDDVVAFLASDRVGFVTGVCVPVGGGRLRGV